MKQILKSLDPPIKYVGGKRKLRKLITALEPEDCRVYVEPFVGSGAVWLYRTKDTYVIINDVNYYITSMFRAIQMDPVGFHQASYILSDAITAGGDPVYKSIRSNMNGNSTFFNGLLAYVTIKSCFNGIFRFNKSGVCNSPYNKVGCGNLLSLGELKELSVRVSNAIIYNNDYKTVLQCVYDNPAFNPSEVWVYLDPPYRSTAATYAALSWKDPDYIELKQVLDNCGFKWLLSINDDPFIRELFSSYNQLELDVYYSCGAKKRNTKGELLIGNYDFKDKALEIIHGKERLPDPSN